LREQRRISDGETAVDHFGTHVQAVRIVIAVAFVGGLGFWMPIPTKPPGCNGIVPPGIPE
jgi:nitrate reductase NapE component